MIHPPIKYIGGKRRVLPRLLSYLNDMPAIDFREPFVGAGSVFLNLQKQRHALTWINDRSPGVSALWTVLIKRRNSFSTHCPTMCHQNLCLCNFDSLCVCR